MCKQWPTHNKYVDHQLKLTPHNSLDALCSSYVNKYADSHTWNCILIPMLTFFENLFLCTSYWFLIIVGCFWWVLIHSFDFSLGLVPFEFILFLDHTFISLVKWVLLDCASVWLTKCFAWDLSAQAGSSTFSVFYFLRKLISENIALRQSLTYPYIICIFNNIHNSGISTGNAIKA